MIITFKQYAASVIVSPPGINLHFSPIDAMIAQDFLCQRGHATESVAVATVEEARARWRKKDKRGRIKHNL